MEQKHDQGPPGEGGKGDSGAGSEVSMDEILTSLRGILEEDQKENAGAAAGLTGTGSPEGTTPGGDEDSGDDGEHELVLTDVVEEAPPEPDPAQEADAEAPGTRDAAEFDTLFTREDTLGSQDPEEGAETGEPTPLSGGPFRLAAEEDDAPAEEGSEPGAPFPFGPGWGPSDESAADPEPSEAGPEAEPNGGSAWSDETDDPEPPPFPGSQPDTGGPDPSPLDPAQESQEEPSLSQSASEPGSSGAEAAAAGVDTERVKEVVQETVEAQVARATEGLDSRLAEALEPKIRDVLREFLDQRLPALLQELAEAEIERIKRGE